MRMGYQFFQLKSHTKIQQRNKTFSDAVWAFQKQQSLWAEYK